MQLISTKNVKAKTIIKQDPKFKEFKYKLIYLCAKITHN